MAFSFIACSLFITIILVLSFSSTTAPSALRYSSNVFPPIKLSPSLFLLNQTVSSALVLKTAIFFSPTLPIAKVIPLFINLSLALLFYEQYNLRSETGTALLSIGLATNLTHLLV